MNKENIKQKSELGVKAITLGGFAIGLFGLYKILKKSISDSLFEESTQLSDEED